MDVELLSKLQGQKLAKWKAFLTEAGLEPDSSCERTALIWDEGELIAAASRQENLLKCIAVDPLRQGEGLTATLLTQLRQDAFQDGFTHLFLYTKPQNRYMFSSLFFYPVAQTKDVLLMENKPNGIGDFLKTLPEAVPGEKIGALVMNCNPFTKGHRYLVDTAARECDHVYIFVLSEDKSRFSAQDRMEMVKLGVGDIPNVTVLSTGPYLISSATFPTYFLKDRENAEQVHCLLDIDIFCKHYAPRFGVTHRYVGTEPLSPMTAQYNAALKAHLPERGICLREIPRLELGAPVSASAVRNALEQGDHVTLEAMLPCTTLHYLKEHDLLEH